jgi:hypothetical protein
MAPKRSRLAAGDRMAFPWNKLSNIPERLPKGTGSIAHLAVRRQSFPAAKWISRTCASLLQRYWPTILG